MKKYIFILLVTLSTIAFSQQVSQYSQYSFNNLGYNPAFIGNAKCLEFKMGGRFQWVGIDGAPTNYYASLQRRLGKNHFTYKGIHAVGGYIERDAIHITENTTIRGAYSFHKKLNNDYTASFGVYVGVQQISISVPRGSNGSDPAISRANGAAIHYPDIMPGVLLYSKKMYFALSVNQLYFKNIKLGTDENKRTNQYQFGAGHKSVYNTNWVIMKSMLLRANFLGPPSLDLNVKWLYRQNLAMGLGYRVGEALMAQVKFKLLDGMSVGYAFDFPINRLYGNYSHEVMISFSQCAGNDIDGGYGVPSKYCPTYK